MIPGLAVLGSVDYRLRACVEFDRTTRPGAENFNQARAFVATNNDGSQVPGGTTDPEDFSNVQYRSNFGCGSFTSQMELNGAGWGDAAFGSQFTFTWDKACVAP